LQTLYQSIRENYLTMKTQVPKEVLELCKSVTAKRPRTVIDHILKHGYITTEELKNTYGYDHPPRAVRDVRDHGIPIDTFYVNSSTTGRRIAAYKFGDPKDIRKGRIGGRKIFSKAFKDDLVKAHDSRSTLTREKLDPRYLQIDHRIPYEIAGNESDLTDLSQFMLLDSSSQRAKSWSCENCDNFKEIRDPSICAKCFWAYPESYTHVAMEPQRRIYLVWQGDEVEAYDEIEKDASKQGKSIQDYIKQIIEKSKR